MVSPDKIRHPFTNLQPVEIFAMRGSEWRRLFEYSLEDHLTRALAAEIQSVLNSLRVPAEEWERRIQVRDSKNDPVFWHKEIEFSEKERFPLTVSFLDTSVGTWIPGVIEGPQSSAATTAGYCVRAIEGPTHSGDSGERILENIPAIRLRMRFPPHEPIE